MRILTLCLAVLVLAASPGRDALAQPKPGAGKLVLEEFFRGPLTASGSFFNTRDGSRRDLTVRMHGTWDGRTLTLVEDFAYSDGEKDRKTWRFTKVAEGRYTGTREDVVGTADIVQDGDAVRLRYTATVRTKEGSSYDIRFDDLLVKTDARTVRNTADLSYFWFIPVGKVDLTIRRAGRR